MIAIFPEISSLVAKGDTERLAIAVRRYFGRRDTYAPKPDIAAMVADAGLRVERLPLDAHGALVAKDEHGAFRIVAIVRASLGAGEERFLLAHMLGHYLFDVQPVIARGEWDRSGYREAACPLRRYVQGAVEAPKTLEARREARADLFAAALLLPLGMVSRALAKLGDQDKVAAFFGVSRPCLQRRLADLGLNQESPVNFLDAEQAILADAPEAGAEEPLDLVAPLEQPMPRSYAASTYGQTARTTARTPAAAAKGEAAATEVPSPAGARGAGARSQPATPPPPASRSSASPNPAAEGGAGIAGKPGSTGMERLRELAKRLDKATREPPSRS